MNEPEPLEPDAERLDTLRLAFLGDVEALVDPGEQVAGYQNSLICLSQQAAAS